MLIEKNNIVMSIKDSAIVNDIIYTVVNCALQNLEYV